MRHYRTRIMDPLSEGSQSYDVFVAFRPDANRVGNKRHPAKVPEKDQIIDVCGVIATFEEPATNTFPVRMRSFELHPRISISTRDSECLRETSVRRFNRRNEYRPSGSRSHFFALSSTNPLR